MGNFLTIYRREMKSYFTSPIAYIFICAFLLLTSVIFFGLVGFFRMANPDLYGYFFFMPWVFAFIIPGLTMRLWSEEKRAGTVELLMTFPLRSWEVVLGKFCACYSVVLTTLILTFFVPLSIASVVELDWGVILASYLGSALIAAISTAVGCWASSLTQNQIVAFMVAMSVLVLITVIGWSPFVDQASKWVGDLAVGLSWFGTLYHYDNFQRGLVKVVGIVYSGSVLAFFLVLNNFAVEWRKY
jgi:ABC-2 type transport system permease protein